MRMRTTVTVLGLATVGVLTSAAVPRPMPAVRKPRSPSSPRALGSAWACLTVSR